MITGNLDRQLGYFSNRLVKRDRHLRKWARREGTDCWRVYDRDIPEIPLVVERYADALYIAYFERPFDVEPAEEAAWLDAMVVAAGAALSVGESGIYRRTREPKRGDEQYTRVSKAGTERVVVEGGLRFVVNLSDYLDSGLFLDHRITRSLVRDDAGGKRVLNLFCYTGSFSVFARDGKADSVTSVDLSNTYLEWAARNMELNGYGVVGKADSRDAFIRADAIAWLDECRRAGERFDLIVLDPPTFSNSKAMESFLDINLHWKELLLSCLAVLEPDGTMYFSTNSRKFRFDPGSVPDAAVEDITALTTPPDFSHRPHRAYRLRSRG